MAGQQQPKGRTPNEAIEQAQREVEASLNRQQATGQHPIEQAMTRAAEEGNPIHAEGLTRMEHLPEQYQQDLPPLSFEQLAKWGVPPNEIAEFARKGLLGQVYMDKPRDVLRDHATSVSKGITRQARIDAGIHADRTLVDPLLELYWTGQAPHPKTGKMVRTQSWIATHTGTVGINGRIWYFESGKLYPKVPTEVLERITKRAVALRDLAVLSGFYSNRMFVPLMQKIAEQGGDTHAAGWAEAVLAGAGERLTVPALQG